MARVVVIGAGVSGLATAARLADFGHEVTVCEQAATVGGRYSALVYGGDTVDATPGPLTLPAVFRDLFRKTGRPLERVLELQPVDPAHRYRFADGTSIDLPHASRAGAGSALDDAIGPDAGAEWRALIDYGGTVWDRVRSPYLEVPPTWRDHARLALPARRRAIGGGRTLRTLGHELLDDARLRRMLEYAAAGADPRRAPAGLAAIVYVHQTFGRWHVAGGMHRLAIAIRDRAVERGAVVRTGARVTAVLAPSGRVAGVQLVDGETLAADVVVSAVDVAHLLGDLVPARLARSARRQLVQARRSPALFTIHLAIRGAATDGAQRRTERDQTTAAATDGAQRRTERDLTASQPSLPPHQTVLFSADADAELDAVFGPSPQPPADPTITVYAPADAADGSNADHSDDDVRVWTVTAVVPPHSNDGNRPGTIDWAPPRLSEAYAERLLDLMGARGVNVHSRIAWRIAWRIVRTPHDTEQTIGVPGGAAWGGSFNSEQALLRRPANSSPVHGLYCVGTSAYPGPGLPLVGLSSVMVADLIGRA